MRKNVLLVVGLSLIALLILGACGAAQTPAVPEEPVATEAPAGGEGVSSENEVQSAPEEPAEAGGQAYPQPQPIEYIQPDPYPTPVQAESIDWAELSDFVQGNNVTQVLQTPMMLIVITMEDGTIYTSTEPAKDEIFKLLDECGQPCNAIHRLSEW